ncbi:hypothetical protein BDV93DRAFT_510956 [Ceratobasidium sp. AG-I]|nr:hypothetical protein BDV93DRAFT_510956 [Ceratobasidium sp. AG-I]
MLPYDPGKSATPPEVGHQALGDILSHNMMRNFKRKRNTNVGAGQWQWPTSRAFVVVPPWICLDPFSAAPKLKGGRLPRVIRNCPLTLKNSNELRQIQAHAEHILAPVSTLLLNLLSMWIKPLKEWVVELVSNPEIQQDLHFDAIQKFCMMGGKWESLPDDGLPICIILYADKALASSWATKKLYPVIAWLANLPRHIRNGKGVGGGRIVGLLPVIAKVEDTPNGLSKTAAANFKCNVWHHAMEMLIDTV